MLVGVILSAILGAILGSFLARPSQQELTRQVERVREELVALRQAVLEERLPPEVMDRLEAKTGMKFNLSANLTDATNRSQTPLALRETKGT